VQIVVVFMAEKDGTQQINTQSLFIGVIGSLIRRSINV